MEYTPDDGHFLHVVDLLVTRADGEVEPVLGYLWQQPNGWAELRFGEFFNMRNGDSISVPPMGG